MNLIPNLTVIIFCVYFKTISGAIDKPLVTISDGDLLGSIEEARNGRQYFRFLGIPYGVVEQRFGVSKPIPPWNGTKVATKLGPTCLQLDFIFSTMTGVEDCLILNVYTPQISDTKLLPTMVFIHGGAFICGSANDYDGSFFMSEDVVLVSINYRLGLFGFLNAEIEGASGNQGLKDQVLALKWVQKNIRAFGGDPDRVTIFGESAGAISVSHLTMSPMGKGLFHAAITQSGMVTCPQADKRESALLEAKKLANLVDCPSSDPKFMVECLRRMKGEELLKQTQFKHPTHFTFDVYDVPQFGPTIETYIPTKAPDSVFHKQDPLKTLFDGTFNKVPLITGITSDEGIFISANVVLNNATLLELMNNEWGRVSPSTFLYHATARDPCSLSTKIRDFYFQDQEISKVNGQKLIDLYSDRWFFHCTRQGALLYAKHAPVYIYYLTHRGEHTFDAFEMTKDSNGLKGPTHADDLIYQFPMPEWVPPLTKGSLDEDFSKKIVGMWTSFAKNDGRPKPWGDVEEWPQLKVSETPMRWLHLDNDLSIQPEHADFTKRMEFWDKLVQPMQMRALDTAEQKSRQGLLRCESSDGYCNL
ncbi:venom carboxylesterase-6 [Folsomia candida]|uniref:venom carboxylesterase-6 n=1 Tax=Folsomia candida TaxID=158441 RepID=UPI001604A70F|nr:venom carboxylesterase-6 [Folsomia candida]